jgi:hypothetical protein
MKLSLIICSFVVLAVINASLGCDAISKIGGSASGTVYFHGRPHMGQIQLLDPKTGGSLKTEPVNNQGHFIISDIPPGEYLLAFLGPSSAPMGEMKYVKIQPGRPNTDIVFEISEQDPLAVELREKSLGSGTETEPK